MARKKQTYVKGAFTHRRTEGDYMGVLLDAVPLEDSREVVRATVAAAKAGDATARSWLAQYLVGKPGLTAPAPLTVVVQQLSGRDPPKLHGVRSMRTGYRSSFHSPPPLRCR